MAHSYAANDDVHYVSQGPQGRAIAGDRKAFVVVGVMPVEADGRRRYRIKQKDSNVERVVYENELERANRLVD